MALYFFLHRIKNSYLYSHSFGMGSCLFVICVYVYVHISLFLPECACTTIIDTLLWIFSLIYCCCVSIIIVNCICPPGALIWLINLFLFLFLFLYLCTHTGVHHDSISISCRLTVTRGVSLMEQELLILLEHICSPPVFSGVRVNRSLVLCVMLCRSSFVLLF